MCVHMAHGLNSVLKRGPTIGLNNNNNHNNNGKNENNNNNNNNGKTGIGSRRIFAPHFKLQVLDSYRNDADCKGNQRATARKYGIHRRQIQKWLQVENNLRNSVCQNNQKNDNNNNNDNSKGVQEERVPALIAPQAPLDYTTNHHHHRSSSPRVASPGASTIIITASPPHTADPATPIDLSLKRPIVNAAPAICPVTSSSVTPLHFSQQQQQQHQEQQVMSPPSLLQPHPDVWDLSTNKGNKRKCENENSPTSTTKTVKLFKPYLDDVFDHSNIAVDETTPPPCCCSNNNSFIATTTPSSDYYYQQQQQQQDTYILHELQPKSSINYHYYQQLPMNCYQINNNDYDMITMTKTTTTTTTYEESNYILPLKQRHNYSLDFKLSAIECYYQDTLCKGNQRAVATKYNIHRRQIQKWLKQADELKQRNESIKHTQTVR